MIMSSYASVVSVEAHVRSLFQLRYYR